MFESFDWAVAGKICLPSLLLLVGLVLWRRREKRREAAGEAEGTLRAWGLIDIADFLGAYEKGNLFGQKSMVSVVRRFIDRVKDKGIPAIFDNVFWQLLRNVHLKSAKGRAKIAEELRIAEQEAAIRAEKAEPVPDVPTGEVAE